MLRGRYEANGRHRVERRPTDRRRRYAALGLLAVAVAISTPAAAASEAAGATTVYLVRHAEKAPGGGDVPLAEPEGARRARDLATALADAGVSVVIVSDFRRTYDTAAPLAAELGIAADEILRITDPAAIAGEIRERWAGGTVLVAGHSNTVPQLIELLGGPPLCPDYFEPDPSQGCLIPDAEYDHLFVLRLPDTGPPTLLRARYGAPSR